jgi:hypothetical protein
MALRISRVKGTAGLPAILFTVSAVPSGDKPLGTQRGGPADIAGTELPYHGAFGVTGVAPRTATRIGRAAAFATRSEPAYSSGPTRYDLRRLSHPSAPRSDSAPRNIIRT